MKNLNWKKLGLPIIGAQFAISLLVLSACSNASPAGSESAPLPAYFIDQRVGICYAAVTSVTYTGYEVTSLTEVDCEKARPLLQPMKP